MVNILYFTTLAFLAVTNPRPRNPRQTGPLPISCRGRQRLTSTEGKLTSPNYPGHYPANSSCNWVITPPGNGSLVSLEFTLFGINSGASRCRGARCRCDFVQVKGLDPPPSGGASFNAKYCDHFPPLHVILITSRVRIRFVSDWSQEGIGFVLKYNTVQATFSPTKRSDFSADANTRQIFRHTLTSETSHGDQEGASISKQQPTTQSVSATGQIPFSDSASKPNTTDGVMTMVPQLHTANVAGNGSIVVIPPGPLPGGTIPTDVPPRTVSPSFRITGRDFGPVSIWPDPSNVVMFVEERKEEEKVPDVIVLGPSIPVVMIFVIVVAGIAWWNYKFDSEELSRYATYQSPAFKRKHKKRMDAIQKGKLYSDMTRDWRGQSVSLSSPGIAGPQRRKKGSFAGKLLELAETVRTPRPSRPSSMASEETVPLNPMNNMPPGPTSLLLGPSAAESSGGGSRPGSIVLREALVKIFSGLDSRENDDSENQSKRTSKRVSFEDEEESHPLLREETRSPERIIKSPEEPSSPDEQNSDQAENRLPRPLQIPAIVVRQASEETDDTIESPVIRRRRDATPKSPTEECEPGTATAQFDALESHPGNEDEVFVEEAPSLEGAVPEDELPGDKQEPLTPDVVSEECDEDPSETSLLFPDLEDFLLNLDKDSPLEDPPYSCAGHIQDILRKSYGGDGPSSLRPEAVLPVPEEYLGMIRGGSRSFGENEAEKEAKQLDDVD